MPLRLHRLLIPLAALLAVLPLLLHGPSCGHDFDFHLLNWLEATSQLRHLPIPRPTTRANPASSFTRRFPGCWARR
jgi:hypothetical protein